MEPDHEYLRRGEVVEWLTAAPIKLSESTVNRMIDGGHIAGVKLPGRKYKLYLTSQVKRVLGMSEVGK